MNSNISYLSLENIYYTTKETESPQNGLVVIGPPAKKRANAPDVEVFDPYFSATVKVLDMQNIYINGERESDVDKLVRVIAFDDVNKDGFSSGRGQVERIFLDGKQVK